MKLRFPSRSSTPQPLRTSRFSSLAPIGGEGRGEGAGLGAQLAVDLSVAHPLTLTLSPKGARGARPSARQAGVALVATLIMLSLVTFMVVAFLGIARRERRTMESVFSQGDSRTAMETALNRAQGDLVARLIGSGDKWNYDLMVSTNYQSSAAFNTGVANPTNVNSATTYNNYFANPSAANLTDFLQNLANLQFDPRLPVFSTNFTNVAWFAPLLSETNQGRFYYDFNQNGIFEPTSRLQTGDPHFVGILEDPNQPHGPNNRAIARYAWLIAPVGKTLDVNVIHNQGKRIGAATESYYRNLSLGPFEMNTAALLAEVNPYWGYNYQLGVGVQSTFAPNTQDAFRDALQVLLYRNNGSFNNYPPLATLFGAGPATTLANEQFDVLGNGPLMNSSNLLSSAADSTAIAWPGGTNTSVTPQQIFDLNDLLLTTKSYSSTITTNIQYLAKTNETTLPAAGDRNRRTFYTLLSTLGVESAPVPGKLNVNWSNAPYTGTNIIFNGIGGDVSGFTSWHPGYFFFNAAELMIRASCSPTIFLNNNWTGYAGTDPLVLATNWTFGAGLGFNYVNTYYTNSTLLFPFLYAPGIGLISNVTAGFIIDQNRTNNGGISLSLTNIPIFPFSYYSGEVHRLLQFAANLYDATTTNNAAPAYPTLFRPMFAFQTNGWPSNDFIRIAGYTTNQTDANGANAQNLLTLPMYDLSDPLSRMAMYQDPNAVVGATGDGVNQLCLVAGTPVIVGAKKGYPNFNEYAMQTVFSLSRKLEYAKDRKSTRLNSSH